MQVKVTKSYSWSALVTSGVTQDSVLGLVSEIFTEGIFADGNFAEGNLAEWNFCRTKFLPNRIFAEWKFRHRNFRRTEFSTKTLKFLKFIFGYVLRILL